MLDMKLDTNEDGFNINIILDDRVFDGGVYMFLIDGLPLYIGETNLFLARLTYHLCELGKEKSYFGLGDLDGKHEITYMILKGNLPYVAKKIFIIRKSDENKKLRVDEQNKYIDIYKPLTQNPAFDIGASSGKKNKDNIIEGVNDVVKRGLTDYKDVYNEIMKKQKNPC